MFRKLLACMLAAAAGGVLSTSAFAQQPGSGQLPPGNWQESCTNSLVNGVILQTVCIDSSGQFFPNIRDLRDASGPLINCAGVLSPMTDCNIMAQPYPGVMVPEGTWRTSCVLEHWNYTSIAARCYDRSSGGYYYSEVEVGGWNGQVQNCDGLLYAGMDCADAGTRLARPSPRPQVQPTPTPQPSQPALPPGSWSSSCSNGRVENGFLMATCRRTDGSLNADDIRITSMSESISNCYGALHRGNSCPALPPGPWRQSCRVTGLSDDVLSVECWRAASSRRSGGGGYVDIPAGYQPDVIHYRRYAGQSFVNCAHDLRLGTQCPN